MNRLSIIIPHYNSPKSLKVLLESILSESSPEETQIIVVDDNSTKDLEEYSDVKRAYDGRVDFYINDTGVKGAGAARNVGLAKANGDYFMFADADDFFLSGWHSVIKEYFDSEYDIVYFNPKSQHVDGETKSYRGSFVSRAVQKMAEGKPEGEAQVRYLVTTVWSKLIKRHVIFDHNVVFQEVMHSNDVRFAMETSYYADKVVADMREIYCITERPGTLTTNLSEEAFRIRFDILCERVAFLRKHLDKREFRYVASGMRNYQRLVQARECKYSRKNRREYLHLFIKYRVPFLKSMKDYYYDKWIMGFKRKHSKELIFIKHIFVKNKNQTR